MKKVIKNALVLTAFSLVLGFVLGAVYKITEPAIAEATRQKEMEAYKVVFENAADFKEIAVDADTATKVMTSGNFQDEINKAFEAVDEGGKSLGYVIQLTTKDGYSGGIVMVIGVTLDGTVNGFSVTAHQETQGLGTKAFDPEYADQFKGIPAADVSGVATISGATLTSSAVKNAINAAVAYTNTLKGEEVVVKTEEDYYKEAFANAANFVEVPVDAAAAAQLMTDGNYKDEINKAFQAVDESGNVLGYVIQVTTKDGYTGGINMVVGITSDGHVNGFSVMSHQETNGLGTKAFDSAYVEKFKGLTAEDVSGVDTISNATMTSSAVKNAVKAALAYANSLGGA